MSVYTKMGSLLGFLAAGVLALFGKSAGRVGVSDLRRLDFGSSMQRLGVKFDERIRRVFRFRWLRKRS